MALKIGMQMDHVSTINIDGDSTFALSMEAQSRGHKLFHYTPDRLQFRGGVISADIEPMRLRNEKGNHFTLDDPAKTDLSTLDVVLLRQDPPFDMSYITSTHLLERIHPDTLVVNDPASVRNAPEKILVMDFPDLMPDTLITRDFNAINDFRNEIGDIIIKPLYGNGGAGVFSITKNDQNLSALLEMFDDIEFTNMLEECHKWEYANYIVLNGHNLPSGSYGIKPWCAVSSNLEASIQFDNNTEELSVNSTQNFTLDVFQRFWHLLWCM